MATFKTAFMRTVPSGAFGRQFRRLPTISWVGTATAGGAAIDFAAMGARRGDLAVFECARGFATAPDMPPGWGAIWPDFEVGLPFYHIGWSKTFSGDADPIGAVAGQHRGAVWRNARVKPGSAVEAAPSVSATVTIPAVSVSGGEVGVCTMAQAASQPSLAAALPDGAVQRWARTNANPAMLCGEGPGWSEKSTALTNSGMFHAVSYVLEPHSGFMFAA